MSASARSLTMPNPSEPLVTHVPARQEWVDDEGGRAARAHQSFMSNNLSSNTIWKMQDKNNIALADADGGGTIDKDEFAQLMKSAGGGATNAQDMALLFAQVDADGDGELTEEEINQLDEMKKLHEKAAMNR